jgi:hypothetical protein
MIKTEFGRGESERTALILARTKKINLLLDSSYACHLGTKSIRDGAGRRRCRRGYGTLARWVLELPHDRPLRVPSTYRFGLASIRMLFFVIIFCFVLII